MHFSLLFSSALGSNLSNTGLLAAIAVLACILGAEIAGISILIGKFLRARRERYERRMSSTEDTDRDSSSYRNFAVVALMAGGAVPQASYIALSVLAVLTAVAALVFAVLLVIFRLCGYDYVSSAARREAEARRNARKAEETVPESIAETPAEAPTEERAADTYESFAQWAPDASEEQRQDAYTDLDEEPLSAFDEAAEESEVTETEEEAIPEAVVVTPVTTTETAVMPAGQTFADGTQPYKVVEKVVTETYKEIYKETPPAQTAAPVRDPATDAVMEKLADFLDYELQKRKEEDKAEADDENNADKSVATFAPVSDEAIDDEDTEDEEELDKDDDLDEGEEGTKSENDEERDDEEDDNEGDRFTGNERIIGFDEETGCYIVAHYRKSFEAKLIQARPNIKKYYSELKNALLSYKGSKNRISWTADSFHNGRTQIAKINVKTRILELYLALDPASLEGTVYRGKDVGDKKKYAETPFRYKLRTPRKFKWAMELVQRTCEEHGLSPIDIEPVNYEEQYPFDTTENLVARKLIKEYIRQEKPANSFELAPDHVTAVPDEDESVIPANANFSWEFDNERMPEPEPEPIEEPVAEPEPETAPEPEVEPVPASEPAPQAQPSIVRETVKVTEMRYTERYYTDAKPTYEQVVTTTEPIEAEAIPAEESVETLEESAEEPIEEIVEETEETEASVEETEDMTDDDAEEPVDVWGDPDVSEEEHEEVIEETAEIEELAEEDVAEEEPSEEDEERFFGDEDEETEAVAASAEAEEFREDAYDDEIDEAAYEEETAEYRAPSVEVKEVYEPEPTPAPKRIVNPKVAVVDICSLEEHFPNDAVINLETLKTKELVLPTATSLKIYASGAVSKSFTVEANHFTIDAIKAVSEADGDIVMVR